LWPLQLGESLLDAFHHQWTEKEINEVRIELCLTAFENSVLSHVDGARFVVAA